MLIKAIISFFIIGVLILPAGSVEAASILKKGSKGTEVIKLQQKLKDQGYFNYANNTGYFGDITKNAVIKLQKDRNISQDGIFGQQTYTALFEGYNLLKFGMCGNSVLSLQKGLKNAGVFSVNCTGYYGKITENAVIAFEKIVGLPIDGIADPVMQSKLYNYNATKSNTAVTDRGSNKNTASSTSSTTFNKSSSDIYWLARIIEAEAGGESYKGKVAVGNVVMNRVNSPEFPNGVYNVIFEYYGNIPQFSPVADGTIYNTPSSESMRAAEEAYYGSKPVGSAIYFLNPAKSPGSWIERTKQYIASIGRHVFYK